MQNVQDVYPLSPMQEFMLLHVISRGDDDVLFDQFCYEIEGGLDAAAFERAWEQLVERHAILRTAFVWEEVKSPVQVVRTNVKLPFEVLDWSDRSAEEQQRALAAMRSRDGTRRFNLSRAPLLRVALIRLAADRHYLVWDSHHLLMDRWCLGTVLDELNRLYEAARSGGSAGLPPAPSFRDYIGWIKAQDPRAAEAFWRARLAGLNGAASMIREPAAAASAESEIARADLSPSDAQRLRSRAREHGLTVNSVVQGAWALVLNAYTGRQDVVFGVAVAGRPAELRDVESILGCFIGNLPARVRLSADQTVLDMLRAVQSAQQAQRRYEYVSPGDVARFGGFDSARIPFDSLLVWLAQEPAEESSSTLRMRGLPGELTTAYPLTLAVHDGADGLSISARLDTGHETIAPLGEILERLVETLTRTIPDAVTLPLRELPGFRGTENLPVLDVGDDAARDGIDVSGVAAGHAAAREAIEAGPAREMLEGHWRAVLGHSSFGADSSFFEVGGTSMLAAALHVRIEASVRGNVPILSLFQAPTLDGMVETLVRADWPLRPDLVFSFTRSGDRAPLFCVASPEVNTIGFALLSTHLGQDRPVHLVQAPPEAEGIQKISLRALPELCARYVAAVRQVNPEGPYLLLGTCSGAQMILEMSRQLVAAGRSVAFVCVIDTWALYTVSRRRFELYRALRRGRYYYRRVGELLSLPSDELLAELRRIAARRRAQGPSGGDPSAAAGSPDPAPATTIAPSAPAPPDRAEVDREWYEEFSFPEDDPHLPKYPGTVTVFRRRRQRRWWRVRDPSLGWSRQAKDVRIEPFDVYEHVELLREPHVREIARRLDECLDAIPDPGRGAASRRA